MSTFDPNTMSGPSTPVAPVSDPLGTEDVAAPLTYGTNPFVTGLSDGTSGETPGVTETAADAFIDPSSGTSDPVGAETPPADSNVQDAGTSDIDPALSLDPHPGLTPAATNAAADASIGAETDVSDQASDVGPRPADVLAQETVQSEATPSSPVSDQTGSDPAPTQNIYGGTVTFNAEGGTPTPESQLVVFGQPVPEPAAPARTSYTFDGWFTAATGGTQWDFASDVISGDVTLYAQWTHV